MPFVSMQQYQQCNNNSNETMPAMNQYSNKGNETMPAMKQYLTFARQKR